jgi:hypothetical protein
MSNKTYHSFGPISVIQILGYRTANFVSIVLENKVLVIVIAIVNNRIVIIVQGVIIVIQLFFPIVKAVFKAITLKIQDKLLNLLLTILLGKTSTNGTITSFSLGLS